MKLEHRKRFVAEINVVPYIDVMLVLLIIFMVTTPLLMQGVEVDLPQANAKAISEQSEEPLIVSVNKKGQLFLNVAADPQRPLHPKALLHRIAAEVTLAKRQHQVRPVLVKGDKNTEYEKIIQAMVLLQKAGVDKVGLMTDDPQKGEVV